MPALQRLWQHDGLLVSAGMTDTQLPAGVLVSGGRGLGRSPEGRPVIKLDLLEPEFGARRVSLVMTPRQARALGALLQREADLVEAPTP